jgi:hypothetical protein
VDPLLIPRVAGAPQPMEALDLPRFGGHLG